MDLAAWVLRAADELAATGAKPRTRRPQPTEPLTSQETRIALHAAKGMSNKEIAAVLFLSPKTVEHHLSSVYRKRGFPLPRGARRIIPYARGRLTRAAIPNTLLMNTAAGKPAVGPAKDAERPDNNGLPGPTAIDRAVAEPIFHELHAL
jgi:DNA-binding CsgD family transcriptional regulator